MHGPSEKRLIGSIHDVGPGAASQVARLADLMAALFGGPRLAMLVVPDYWGRNPLQKDKAFCARLRDWADSGIEMFVHGWYHRDEESHSGVASLKARYMTAGEGEFLGLSAEEAARRMRDGRSLIEDIIGCPVAGFIAPAWLYGPGALEALAQSGFALAENHMKVWKPDDGEVVARGPVITWASRSRWRALSSICFADLACSLLSPLETVRVAVHPGDLNDPHILASIERTLKALLADREVGRYSDLVRD